MCWTGGVRPAKGSRGLPSVLARTSIATRGPRATRHQHMNGKVAVKSQVHTGKFDGRRNPALLPHSSNTERLESSQRFLTVTPMRVALLLATRQLPPWQHRVRG